MYDNIRMKQKQGDHHISTDRRLSLKARGLWFTLWSLRVEDGPEKFTLAEFVKDYSGEGFKATQNAFFELKNYGYIREEGQGFGVRYYTMYERG